jgi:hypothetical protein
MPGLRGMPAASGVDCERQDFIEPSLRAAADTKTAPTPSHGNERAVAVPADDVSIGVLG